MEKSKFNQWKFANHAFFASVSGIAALMGSWGLWANPLITTLFGIFTPLLVSIAWELYGVKGGAKFSWRDVWYGTSVAWVIVFIGWLSVLVGNFWQLPK